MHRKLIVTIETEICNRYCRGSANVFRDGKSNEIITLGAMTRAVLSHGA
jgi:transketolase C-terminal domain/subunit